MPAGTRRSPAMTWTIASTAMPAQQIEVKITRNVRDMLITLVSRVAASPPPRGTLPVRHDDPKVLWVQGPEVLSGSPRQRPTRLPLLGRTQARRPRFRSGGRELEDRPGRGGLLRIVQ